MREHGQELRGNLPRRPPLEAALPPVRGRRGLLLCFCDWGPGLVVSRSASCSLSPAPTERATLGGLGPTEHDASLSLSLSLLLSVRVRLRCALASCVLAFACKYKKVAIESECRADPTATWGPHTAGHEGPFAIAFAGGMRNFVTVREANKYAPKRGRARRYQPRLKAQEKQTVGLLS